MPKNQTNASTPVPAQESRSPVSFDVRVYPVKDSKYILVRLQGKKESDVFSYLSRIEKSIKDNGFTVRRATEEDLKRMLGVYFEQNVTTERYEDHDGERWVLFGE